MIEFEFLAGEQPQRASTLHTQMRKRQQSASFVAVIACELMLGAMSAGDSGLKQGLVLG